MTADLNEILKAKIINGWKLWWLITVPVSAVMVLGMARVDLTSAEDVSSMIQLSVRHAVPLLFVAFAASSVQALFPGSFGRWLLRNRPFIGLSFAAAMAWQLIFILWLVTIHTDYYVNEVYVLSDVVEGVSSYVFLIAMVLTSFKFGRRRLTPRQWKLLHTTGIYWLWCYAWIVYWYNLFYYESPALFIDYVYYWGGFLAWGLRLAAWSKKRSKRSAGQSSTDDKSTSLFLTVGFAALVVGLTGISFARAWSPQVFEFMYGFKVIEFVEPYVPYSPLIPFYPMFLMILGASFVVKSRA
ncbi:MAG: hypothetical protein IIA07_02505 [Proteobacteria bacterium]|nr:hypothetical protein [Pseudomonadota bacterium]